MKKLIKFLMLGAILVLLGCFLFVTNTKDVGRLFMLVGLFLEVGLVGLFLIKKSLFA